MTLRSKKDIEKEVDAFIDSLPKKVGETPRDAIKSFIHSLRLADLKAVREGMSEYCEHKLECIRSTFSAGRPTENGGYEQKFGNKWYQTSPIDKTPKCDCGLNELLSLLDEKINEFRL